MAVEHLTLETFKEKIFDYEKEKEWKYKGTLPAVIDFYADWCGPCKMVSPIIEKLSEEYKGKVAFYKVDTDREQQLAAMFGIRSIPTLVFIPLNEQPKALIGAVPEHVLREVIENELLKGGSADNGDGKQIITP
ncbi:MAG: thioredoxin [Chlorobi bacterium]|nr:thioredoxin [Chlorobiota bacterium]